MRHKNFFETVAEANIRLRNTVIWYDGPGEQGPYHVMLVTGDSGDDFKIYMKKLGQKYSSVPNVIPPNDHIGSNTNGAQALMDQFMKNHPGWNMVRKDLSSPYFKSFRPFPLGMMNQVKRDKAGKAVDCETLFLERQPNRATQQGLTKPMIYAKSVNAAISRSPKPVDHYFDTWSQGFYDCILGKHPSIDECLSNLTDRSIANEAAAFHRYFAIVKGPCDMLFLSYKGEVVGMLDNRNRSSITVASEYKYTREAIDDLRVFNSIKS